MSSDGGDSTIAPKPQELYKELTEFFGAHAGEVLEIEVLPTGFPLPWGATLPILQDGPNLGITKKALVQAFLMARDTFFNTLKLNTPNEEEAEEAMTATQVILLFDPEHVTAANFRKRRLLSLRASRNSTTSESQVDIRNELVYLESLLTSPLHRHTKSPTLWHHRRWLVMEFFDQICRMYDFTGSPQANSKETFEPLWSAELEVIERSGDRHPRNYYAWAYARWLLEYLAEKDLRLPDESVILFLSRSSALKISVWCLAHPTDISGWSFLVYLLQSTIDEPELQGGVFDKVWKFTGKLSWEGEAVWWFLRTVLAMEGILPVGVRRQYVERIVEGLQTRSTGQMIGFNTDQISTSPVAQAVRFCAKFGHLEGAPAMD